MKRFLAAVSVASLAASAALAGGPVVVQEEGQPEVLQERSSSAGWLPLIVGLVVLCAVACDGGDDDVVQTGMEGNG